MSTNASPAVISASMVNVSTPSAATLVHVIMDSLVPTVMSVSVVTMMIGIDTENLQSKIMLFIYAKIYIYIYIYSYMTT